MRPGDTGRNPPGSGKSLNKENKMNELNTMQISQTTVGIISRSKLTRRAFSRNDGFYVATKGFDKNGDLKNEELKSRGYKYNVTFNHDWLKAFDTEEQAETEINEICGE